MTRLVPPDAGWTKTPNRLLDETARAGARLPARHRSIVDVLVRETLGWHVDAVAISQRTLAARLGVSARTVREPLADLERWRVIRRRGAGRGRVALIELLDPKVWRITKTAGAIRRAERRRLALGVEQPWLPFPDVAEILDLPTRVGVRTRDTSRDVPRGSVAALLVKRKKSKEAAMRTVRDNVRAGDRMPNDEPQTVSEEDLARIRRIRAARNRVVRLGLGGAFDDELVTRVASELSEQEVADEIRRRQVQLDEQAAERRGQLQAENMRHERRR